MGQQEYPAGYDEAATHEDAAAYSSEASDRVLLPPQTETVPRASCRIEACGLTLLVVSSARERQGRAGDDGWMEDGYVWQAGWVGLGHWVGRRGEGEGEGEQCPPAIRDAHHGKPKRPQARLPSSLTFFFPAEKSLVVEWNPIKNGVRRDRCSRTWNTVGPAKPPCPGALYYSKASSVSSRRTWRGRVET